MFHELGRPRHGAIRTRPPPADRVGPAYRASTRACSARPEGQGGRAASRPLYRGRSGHLPHVSGAGCPDPRGAGRIRRDDRRRLNDCRCGRSACGVRRGSSRSRGGPSRRGSRYPRTYTTIQPYRCAPAIQHQVNADRTRRPRNGNNTPPTQSNRHRPTQGLDRALDRGQLDLARQVPLRHRDLGHPSTATWPPRSKGNAQIRVPVTR